MYEFHYNYIKAKNDDRATLLFADTDSLCYSIRTNDIYRDMQEDADLFDFSEYPPDHFLYSTQNKKVLCTRKDETHSFPIIEFIRMRPKMYSLLFNNK